MTLLFQFIILSTGGSLKKYNRVNSNWMILGLVLPILIFFISMNIVYAYFTATATPAVSESKTGVIRIGFTETTTEKINSASIDASQLLVPGDNLEIDGAIENKGLSAVYSILKFDVEISKNNSTLKHITKYYTIKNVDLDAVTEEDNNLTEIAGNEDNYTATAFYLEAANEDKSNTYITPFKITYNFDGAIYGNDYQGANVNYTATAYAIQTVNLTDDASKEQMVATNLLMDNASYKNVTLLGNSYQPTYTGKNLLPYPYVETTHIEDGITFTDNGDGTITANGTATGDAVFLLLETVLTDMPSARYVYSGCPAGGSADTYYMLVTNTGHQDIGNGVTPANTDRIYRVRIVIKTGTTVNNLVFKPMVESTTDGIKTAYEPYTGGLAGPSPAVPIEVQSLGEKTKNLFNIKAIKTKTIKLENDGKTITLPINLANGYTNTATTLQELCPDLKVGDVAVLSFKTTSKLNNFIHLSKPKITWYSTSSKTITQDMLDSDVILYANNNSKGENYNVQITDFQIELGTTRTDYEPYGYKIEYTKTSKNLVNPDIVEIHTVGSDERLITTSTVKVKKNTVYVISVDSYSNSSPKWAIKGWDTERKNLTINEAWSGGTSIASVQDVFNSGDYEYITIRAWNSNKYYGIDSNTKIQIEEGTTATDYVPYHENSSGVIYLDQPLRKVGDVADYIDLATGTVVRNITTLNVTSSINYSLYTWNNKRSVFAYQLLEGDSTYNRVLGLSNRNFDFSSSTKYETSMWLGVGNKGFYWLGILDYLNFEDDENSTAIDKFKVWLDSNPTYVYYATTSPKTENIDLPDIGEFNEGTIFTFNTTLQPSDIIIDA